jgi:phage N-6-adenine-methyltransferase
MDRAESSHVREKMTDPFRKVETMGKTIWSTPQSLFDKLNREFRFDVDVCADPDNQKCPDWFQRHHALSEDWRGTCFLNPPYGREISGWMRKAYEESQKNGATVVCLIPARTNAPWWHEFVMKADEIRFIRKKVPFTSNDGKKGVPSFGSAIAIFRCGNTKQPIVTSYSR